MQRVCHQYRPGLYCTRPHLLSTVVHSLQPQQFHHLEHRGVLRNGPDNDPCMRHHVMLIEPAPPERGGDQRGGDQRVLQRPWQRRRRLQGVQVPLATRKPASSSRSGAAAAAALAPAHAATPRTAAPDGLRRLRRAQHCQPHRVRAHLRRHPLLPPDLARRQPPRRVEQRARDRAPCTAGELQRRRAGRYTLGKHALQSCVYKSLPHAPAKRTLWCRGLRG